MLDKLLKLKKQLDSLRPFSPDALHNLEKWFEVELTYTSNAIEGNTLTRAETALVLEKGLTVGGKPMKDHLEAINHLNALQKMKEMTAQKNLTLHDILLLHEYILKSIDDANAGVVRSINVRISGAMVVLPNPLKVPYLLDEFMAWLEEENTEHPVQKAALAHYKFVSIHPFIDGNGRTARLLMNLILIKNGYPPAIIGPKDRLKYIKSLEKAQLGGSLEDYLNLIYKSVIHSFGIYMKALGNVEITEKYEDKDKLLKIGILAKETHETISTIRYWSKIGLLDVATTTASGYQLYSQDMVARIKKIRELQEKRFTLEEILKTLETLNP